MSIPVAVLRERLDIVEKERQQAEMVANLTIAQMLGAADTLRALIDLAEQADKAKPIRVKPARKKRAPLP